MEIQALTLTWVASVTFTVTPMQNTHYCIMQRANMQLRNICSGPMKMTHFVWCRRSLWNDIAHSASPVSTFSSVHLAAKKGAHYHAENGSPPPPLLLLPTKMRGSDHGGSVCVCVYTCLHGFMCAWRVGGERECATGECAPAILLIGHSRPFVGSHAQGGGLWKLWLLPFTPPLPKNDIITTLFFNSVGNKQSTIERGVHLTDDMTATHIHTTELIWEQPDVNKACDTLLHTGEKNKEWKTV